MPMAPLKPCMHPGCRELVRGRARCEKHEKLHAAAVDSRRPNARKRGYDNRWHRARSAYLRKHSLCVECRRVGIKRFATCVDHITPHHGNETLFWDESNWQPLCAECHSKKTAREDGGFGNRQVGGIKCPEPSWVEPGPQLSLRDREIR